MRNDPSTCKQSAQTTSLLAPTKFAHIDTRFSRHHVPPRRTSGHKLNVWQLFWHDCIAQAHEWKTGCWLCRHPLFLTLPL